MSIYRNALDVQSASNLSGVVLQFARDMEQDQRGSTCQRRRHRAGQPASGLPPLRRADRLADRRGRLRQPRYLQPGIRCLPAQGRGRTRSPSPKCESNVSIYQNALDVQIRQQPVGGRLPVRPRHGADQRGSPCQRRRHGAGQQASGLSPLRRADRLADGRGRLRQSRHLRAGARCLPAQGRGRTGTPSPIGKELNP